MSKVLVRVSVLMTVFRSTPGARSSAGGISSSTDGHLYCLYSATTHTLRNTKQKMAGDCHYRIYTQQRSAKGCYDG